MLASITFWTGMVAMASVCGLAIWRGGRVERQVGVVVALAWLASWLAPNDLASPLWVVTVIDAGLLPWFLYLALYAGRPWTLCLAAFQLLIVCTHIAFITNDNLEQWGYLSAYYVWSFCVLGALLGGTLFPRRVQLDKP